MYEFTMLYRQMHEYKTSDIRVHIYDPFISFVIKYVFVLFRNSSVILNAFYHQDLDEFRMEILQLLHRRTEPDDACEINPLHRI